MLFVFGEKIISDSEITSVTGCGNYLHIFTKEHGSPLMFWDEKMGEPIADRLAACVFKAPEERKS